MRWKTTSFFHVVVIVVLTSINIEAVWIPPYCPLNCTCSGTDNTHLWVDCQGRFGGAENLVDQLDSLLSSNLTLTTLTIVNTPLTQVPRSICRIKTLIHLALDNNRLTRLPDNCLSNLKDLNKLEAIQNNITWLQDGLLSGLHHLQTVVLRQNQIVTLGSLVFANSSHLRYVDISNNLIQNLDLGWAYEVGSNGDADSPAEINVQHNRISKFTNIDGLKLKCGMKRVYASVDIRYNEIRHLSYACLLYTSDAADE